MTGRCAALGAPAGAASRGFGLLEALVALVLFSLVGLAMFGWINSNLDAASRLLAREQVQHAQHLATAWAQTLDPARQARGEAEPEPGWRVTWDARPLTPWTAGAPLPGGTSTPFRLRLYEVELAVHAPSLGRGAPELARVQVTRTAIERDAAGTPAPPPADDRR